MATELYGLLGWPAHHSASPAMMEAAFRQLGRDAVYLAFAVRPDRFAEALRGLFALGAVGANVTIPHKTAAWMRCDERTTEAEMAGAVNTIRFDADRGRLIGHNTDIAGWWDDVTTVWTARGRLVTLLGAGGVARAVLAALALHLPGQRVHLAARDMRRSEALVRTFPQLAITPVPWPHRHDSVADSELVVNCTPIGMWPDTQSSPIEDSGCLRPGQVIHDLVYRPTETALLRAARSQGALALGGLGMLVRQGAEALTYWTGEAAPVAAMAEAAARFLQV